MVSSVWTHPVRIKCLSSWLAGETWINRHFACPPHSSGQPPLRLAFSLQVLEVLRGSYASSGSFGLSEAGTTAGLEGAEDLHRGSSSDESWDSSSSLNLSDADDDSDDDEQCGGAGGDGAAVVHCGRGHAVTVESSAVAALQAAASSPAAVEVPPLMHHRCRQVIGKPTACENVGGRALAPPAPRWHPPLPWPPFLPELQLEPVAVAPDSLSGISCLPPAPWPAVTVIGLSADCQLTTVTALCQVWRCG
jgi:hypothetical protein